MTGKNIESKIILGVKDIKLIRALVFPFANISRKVSLRKYRNSIEADAVKKLKNKYNGKRCFILGNGPSLTLEDLELLKEEFTFGANRIFSLYDKTEWRPDVYMCVDRELLRNYHKVIEEMHVKYKFIEMYGKKYFPKKTDDTYYFYSYAPFSINYVINPSFSKDISKGMWSGQTVTFSAMQIAVYMGFKEIYLLGVDHSYRKTIDEKGRVIINDNVKDYSSFVGDIGLGVQYVDGVTKAYKAARQYCEQNGVVIKNATRGGKLEIFDRVNLEDVLKKK